MPIEASKFEEFLSSETARAREIAEEIRKDINLPIIDPEMPERLRSNLTPIHHFCYFLKYQPTEHTHREEKLKILLEIGADPNVYLDHFGTPLIGALKNNASIEFIKLLLDAKADINFAADKGRSSIFWAVELRKFDELRLLIDRGGKINQLNQAGHTALTEEINRNEASLEVVNFLIDHDADVNASGSLLASLSGWGKALHITQTLIDSGADVNATDIDGASPLALAAAEKKCPTSILNSLVQSGAIIDSVDNEGWTPLIHAVARGNTQAVKFLLSHQASISHCDTDGKSALHWCCKKGQAEIVSLLIDAGADINLADQQDSESRPPTGGRTPLMYAVHQEGVTKALLKHGPNVNLVDGRRQSALMHAVAGYSDRKAPIVEMLLKKGAKVNLSDEEGNTVLHLISKDRYSTESVVKVLLDSKAEVDARNNADETPLMLCNNAKSVELLIKGGAHPNSIDKAGKTALIHSVNKYDSDIHLRVKVLLNAKCDPDIRDSEGKTALIHAAKSDSNHKSVKLLVEHGANLDLVDNNGYPATAFADTDNLMLLISSGAKPSIYEGSRLEKAINNDNLPLSALLLERGAQMKLSLTGFVHCKKIFEKLARANAEILRSGIVCTEPEAQEQFDALLAKFKRNADVAADEELPPILRKGAWPVKTATRKQIVLPAARVSELDESIDYLNGAIRWPEDLRETVLREFNKHSALKNTRPLEQSSDDPREYLAGLLKKKGSISFSALFKNWTIDSDAEFIRFWNSNAVEINEQVAIKVDWRERPMDADEISYLLARFDLAVLPGILETQKKSFSFAEALRFVDAPAVARLMSRGMASGPITRIARQWALRYPQSCATGLIIDAISKVGKDRSAAEASLRFLAANGHKSVVESVSKQFGADVAESVAETLAQDHRADFMPVKTPKPPKFWSADVYPQPRLKSNNKELPAYAVDAIASMMAMSTSEVRAPALDAVIEACDPESLAEFAWDAFEEWAAKGQKDSEWIFDSLTYFGNDACARKLTPYIRNWPRENGIARARKGLEILAAIGTDVALSQIQAISQKNKYQSVLQSAQEMMKRIAVARDLKPQQLEDRLVPDLGLSESGEIKLSFGSRYFIGSVNAALKPVIRDASGAVLKALPTAGKDDDKALAKESAALWSELCKELKPVSKLQLERLELAMVQSRRWSGSDFKPLLVVHPLLQNLVKGLVWGVFQSKTKLSATFMVNADHDFVDAEEKPVKIADGSSIGIVHPLLMDESSLAAWQELFTKKKQLQPFAQLARKTYRPIDDLENNRFGLQGATVASKALKGLLTMGWTPDIADAGWILEFDRSFSTGRASLSVEPGVHINDYEMNANEQKIDVSIPDTLNFMEFSETIRELLTLRK